MHSKAQLIQIFIYDIVPEEPFIPGTAVSFIHGIGQNYGILHCKIGYAAHIIAVVSALSDAGDITAIIPVKYPVIGMAGYILPKVAGSGKESIKQRRIGDVKIRLADKYIPSPYDISHRPYGGNIVYRLVFFVPYKLKAGIFVFKVGKLLPQIPGDNIDLIDPPFLKAVYYGFRHGGAENPDEGLGGVIGQGPHPLPQPRRHQYRCFLIRADLLKQLINHNSSIKVIISLKGMRWESASRAR